LQIEQFLVKHPDVFEAPLGQQQLQTAGARVNSQHTTHRQLEAHQP
jgi:hypothetical protein